jgi:hypothetical protein
MMGSSVVYMDGIIKLIFEYIKHITVVDIDAHGTCGDTQNALKLTGNWPLFFMPVVVWVGAFKIFWKF